MSDLLTDDELDIFKEDVGPFGQMAMELITRRAAEKWQPISTARHTVKLRCTERHCNWHGTLALEAPNPFYPGATIQGCPDCKSVETIAEACDEPDCWAQSCCGWPTPEIVYGGYRRTCQKHYKPQGAKG